MCPILFKKFMVIEEVIRSNSVAGMNFENLMVQKLSTENRWHQKMALEI